MASGWNSIHKASGLAMIKLMKPVTRYTFSQKYRLKSSNDFQRVFNARVSTSDRYLVVYLLPNQCDYPRLGISVGRRMGNAVLRNRYKRTLREAFRLSRHEIPSGYDLVLVPRSNVSPQMEPYRQSLMRLTAILDRRWRKRKIES